GGDLEVLVPLARQAPDGALKAVGAAEQLRGLGLADRRVRGLPGPEPRPHLRGRPHQAPPPGGGGGNRARPPPAAPPPTRAAPPPPGGPRPAPRSAARRRTSAAARSWPAARSRCRAP